MDHAGEGIHAASFLAALESLAFVESDRDRLLDQALDFIPGDSELAAAIGDTRAWWGESDDWRQVQKRLAQRYLTDNFTDVVINLAYTVLGWLAGDEFGQAICIAVNCGQDTDCTGATLGALLGILDPDSIDAKWLEPIGRDLVLSPGITAVEHPPTLDGFTDLVLSLRQRLDPSTPPLPKQLQDLSHLAIPAHLAFVGVMPDGDAEPTMPADAERVDFEGNWVRLSAERCTDAVALVRYRFSLQETRPLHVIFASPQPVRVWIDGERVIDCGGGEFVPALHRTQPEGSDKRLVLEPGRHTLTAAVICPGRSKPLEWALAFADDHAQPVERNWLIDPLRASHPPTLGAGHGRQDGSWPAS